MGAYAPIPTIGSSEVILRLGKTRTNMSSTNWYILHQLELCQFGKHLSPVLVFGKIDFLKSSEISTFPDIFQNF